MSDIDQINAIIRSHYGEGFIPLHAPCFNGREKETLMDCIDSTFVSSVGRYVDEFEQQFAKYTGSKYAVAVVNGTMGLMLALRLVGVKPGDLVLTQSLTFVATANAISMLGAEPVFLDVGSDSLGMSADDLQQFLETQTIYRDGELSQKNTRRRISACVPMHTLGFACKIDRITKICQEYSLAMVEDAAESLGTFYRDQHTGTFGDFGVFSFNGNKVITTGGGGILVTNNQQLAEQAKHLSTTAKIPHAWQFEHDAIAYNLRMPNLNAALGVAQMEGLNEFLVQKRQLAESYHRRFQAMTDLRFLTSPSNMQSNHWLNSVVFDTPELAEKFLRISNEQGIQTRPLWTPMHQLKIYKHCHRNPQPNTEYVAGRLVNIPSGVKCDLTIKRPESSCTFVTN